MLFFWLKIENANSGIFPSARNFISFARVG